jgi:hypothetical protein
MTDYWDHPEYKKLEKENERLAARVAELEGAIQKHLEPLHRLDCMLASHAKSKRAYGTMQDIAESAYDGLSKALAGERDDE